MQKRARERGRSIIDSEFLTEIRNESMLRVAKCIRGFGFEELSMDAFEVAKAKMRKLPHKVEVIEEIKAFLGERTQKNEMVLAKFQRYLEMIPGRGLPWTEEALARLERAPAFVRALARRAIEAEARRRGEKVVTPHLFSSPPGERQGEGGEDKGEGVRSQLLRPDPDLPPTFPTFQFGIRPRARTRWSSRRPRAILPSGRSRACRARCRGEPARTARGARTPDPA